MHSHRDHYIHELSVDTIISLLEKSAWKSENQTITSAITNDNNLNEPDAKWINMGENTAGPNAFSDIQFDRQVKRVLDVGGGQFDSNKNYMKQAKNIDLLVWDPYNRSHTHNAQVKTQVIENKVDAVTSMSVLNVIPEVEVRLAHINTVKAALLLGGKAYFKIWPGEYPLLGSYLPCSTESYYQSNAYADRFLREIEVVFGIGNVRLDSTIPNLIIATKVSESHTHRDEIVRLQRQSSNELAPLNRIREHSVGQLYMRENIYRLFSTKPTFLKKMEDDYIERHRISVMPACS